MSSRSPVAIAVALLAVAVATILTLIGAAYFVFVCSPGLETSCSGSDRRLNAVVFSVLSLTLVPALLMVNRLLPRPLRLRVALLSAGGVIALVWVAVFLMAEQSGSL